MRFIKKHKKLITALTAVLLIAVSLGTYVSQTWAAYDTWNSLAYMEFRTGLGEGQHSMTDVRTYGGNYTNDVGKIYSDRSHFFDDIRLEASSRVTYTRKIRVNSGQRLTIVAAQEDTADAGGLTENAGLQFYWSVGEYDENGNIVFDGGWRGSSGTWTVGVTENGDTGYGKSGYPNGEDISTRQNKVRYVVPIFRWNNGDETVGSGSNLALKKADIPDRFHVFTMITDPFTYTFNLNGGQVNGSGSAVTMQRLGIENVSVPQTPTRNGYVFTGWKITSTGGKQAGKVYDAGQLAEMFTDGKYWSSLFEDATFEAQWVQADCFVSYMGNGADNMSDFYRSYNAAYDGNTAENFLFKRTGYTSVSGSTWEIKDQFLNLTGGRDGGGTLPSSGTLTSIRTKCGGRYQCVDISAASYADGANAQIWDCVNGNAQMYAFVFAGFEDGLPYWVIRNNATGKVLDAAIGTGIDGGNNGANIQQWAYHGGDNQKWTLQMAGDGYFYIRSKLDPNLVLDLLYGSTDNGTNLQLCNYYGGENQQWYLWDNTINLSAEWTNSNYKVDYNADGGTLLDENGNATIDTVRTYEYDKTYDFLKAKRAYTVSYETNGGTAATGEENTNAQAEFNGWNEQLDSNTTHGEVQGLYDWTIGTLNWAAYYNGNPDILNAAGNVYDTIRAIMHYRAFGISENRQFTGASYWLPSVRFKNLTANGGTVNVKADYTNGTVTLPNAEKASVEIDGKNVSYTFDGWYLDSALTNRVGGAGDTYTPAGNTTLYAKYTTRSENLIFNQKIRVRYENADGTWTSYTTIFDKDFRTGDTVDYDFGSLDTDKWVRPAVVKYTVSGQYQTEGYTTSVDIYRQTYNVTVTYDNADAFSAKSGEGTYRWGENVTASVTLSEKTAQYTYKWAGFETESRLTFRNGTSKTSNPVTFVMPEENVTLKACSASQTNEYTVTVEHYYMDTAGNYPDKPSVAEALTPYYGETLVHKTLAREIKGLSFNENKTIQENGNRTQTEVKGNTTVRLYYDRTVCTVTYDYRTNGGTSADKETVKTYYGADADISVAAYKNGWEHAGWNTESDSETGLTRYTVTGNVTLYAVYRKDITVTFVDFAQTYKREGSMYNNDTYALIDAPQCSAYGGWENVSDVTAVGFNSRADIIAEGAEKMEVKSGEEHLKIPDSITYYTVCRADVTLTYELNGGTENDTTKPVTKTVYCNAAAPQEVKGFKLQLGESVKESVDLDGYTHSYAFAIWAQNSPESETRFPCNADYVLKKNTVMYAVWDETVTPITYYIEFDGNAGTAARNVPERMEVQYGEEVVLPEQKPERTGFTFMGWNTRTDGQGTEYQPQDTVKNLTTVNHATVKLYAQWKQRRIILVKAASTVYNDTIIKRIPGDEEWYDSVGHLTIDELKNYPDELCEQVWHIDKQGNITQVK
ncbi:InlB B-repeat-containing protein [Lachnospira pectinoschiza]|uniref:InlB B-repeat-containing protein n=1 Tax=Lachnospira pectinoschiza TaxID=28052 RepID=UPI001D05C829|nr:InlB B-repeat-containing protein [Lachnospira pectinoschiza]MCB6142479.1 InlB B-repeat-containing protein [Lachnospira pectinoschiza]